MLRCYTGPLGYRYALAPLLILAITIFAWTFSTDRADREFKQRFELAANQSRSALEQRLQLYTEALRGLQGLYAASQTVTRDEFYNYVHALNLDKRYPGFQALSFNRLVLPEQKEAFEKEVRRDASLNPDGYPDFAIKPAGRRKEHVVVEFIEPMAGNEQALGFDVASNPIRRDAIEQTRDKGVSIATGPIILVQETHTQSGFLVFMPIYRNGASLISVEQRRRAFSGVVVAVFRVDDLLKEVVSDSDLRDFTLKIQDSGPLFHESNNAPHEATKVIFDSNTLMQASELEITGLRQQMTLEVAGRSWLLSFQARKSASSVSAHALPMFILGGGIFISLLLFGLLWSFGSRRLAVDNANRMAVDLHDSREHLKIASTVFENSSEGLMVTDADANILAVNQAFTEITGYSPAEVLNRTPRMLRSDWQDDAFYDTMWKSLLTKGRWQGEIWSRHKDGSLVAEWLTINANRNTEGETTHYVGLFRDITEEKRAQEHIQHLAYHDSLTDLPNRSLLEDRIANSISQARRDDLNLAVMFIDLDRFKTINDSLGHHIGDKLLQQVAIRLRGCLRESDTVARLGGDEFVILLPAIQGLDGTSCVASKITERLNDVFHIGGHAFHTSASIGISLFPQDGEDCGVLMKHADTAMYHAKGEGRNNYQFFNAQMNKDALDRLEIEQGLREALEKQQLELFFQPQVDIKSEEIVGLEALIRWRHPVKGIMTPEKFIPIAEESDLILAIGDWVLLEACRQGKALQEMGHTVAKVAVNLSARQFETKNGLLGCVETALKKSGLEPQYLELEITETVLMEHMDTSIATLTALHEMGVSLSLDDFGTGYSSLNYLKRFPIDTLKIDRSFISNITTDSESTTIVNAIITLAHNLGLKVIAEGVETQEQLEYLQQQESEIYQGYLCSWPVPAERLPGLLESADKRRESEGYPRDVEQSDGWINGSLTQNPGQVAL